MKSGGRDLMPERKRPAGAGIGLRLPHLVEVAATHPAVNWFEIHPENFLANPHATELLEDLSRIYPVSVHTVGVSIGSADGVDMMHLKRVRTLIEKIDPFQVSGHLAWSTHEGEYLNDLLPLPYDKETLELLVKHVDVVQQALGRTYLVENPSSYLGFGQSTMKETEFLAELASRTGCRLLCDVSNIHVSSFNLGYDAYEYADAFPGFAIAEYHLGGFTEEEDETDPGHNVLIDTHARPIADPAWDLYAHMLRRHGSQPTLIEWDNELPDLATLIVEAQRADRVMRAVHPPEARRAVG